MIPSGPIEHLFQDIKISINQLILTFIEKKNKRKLCYVDNYIINSDYAHKRKLPAVDMVYAVWSSQVYAFVPVDKDRKAR